MKLKRLRLPLMLTALTAVLTVGAFAADEHSHCVCGGENTVGDHTEHQAVEWTAWEENDQLPTEDGYYYLTEDVRLNGYCSITADINLCLNGHNVIQTSNCGSSSLYINKTGSLTLTDCASTAGNITADNATTYSGIGVDGGTFVMYNGTFTGFYGNSGGANIISLRNGASFIMNGGSLRGCTFTDGVGISSSESSIVINAGTIDGNAENSIMGGIDLYDGSTLTMNGGIITNTRRNGVLVFKNTTIANSGTLTELINKFTFNSGTIENCGDEQYCAVYNIGIFTFNGGYIGNSDGCGVYSITDFIMNGGTIDSCKDSGIIFDYGYTLTMNGGTIRNCGGNDKDSAGILVYDGTVQFSGEPIITDNYDDNGRSRDIYLWRNTSKITVTGTLGDSASFGIYCEEAVDDAIVGSNDYALTASDLQKFHSENLQLVLNPKTTNGKLEGRLEYRKATAFSDVGTDYWCYNAVNWAVENGITNGTTETTFGPTNGCTRAQMVTFLWRAAGMPHAKNSVNPFTDVSPNRYYYDAVLWAVEQGITTGATETTFEPDRLCTRGHIVTFLWRAAGKPSHSTASSPFTDVAKNAYCSDAVLWASENGITQGMTATSFAPNRTCTRAQVVTFLYRAQSYLQ